VRIILSIAGRIPKSTRTQVPTYKYNIININFYFFFITSFFLVSAYCKHSGHISHAQAQEFNLGLLDMYYCLASVQYFVREKPYRILFYLLTISLSLQKSSEIRDHALVQRGDISLVQNHWSIWFMFTLIEDIIGSLSFFLYSFVHV
jgi:hypothetical protein